MTDAPLVVGIVEWGGDFGRIDGLDAGQHYLIIGAAG